MKNSIYINCRSFLLFLQTLAAVQMFGFYLRKRIKSIPVQILIALTGAVLCNLYADLFYIRTDSINATVSRTVCMILVYCTVIGAAFLLYRVSWPTALLTACAGYAAQNVAGSVKGMLRLFPLGDAFWNSLPYELLMDIFCYGTVYLVLWFVFRGRLRTYNEEDDNVLKAAFSVTVLLLCVGMSRLAMDVPNRTLQTILAENLYAAISSMLLLLVQYGSLQNRQLNRDVDVMRELIHTQHTQFETSRECSRIIEEKYHDLNKMIDSLTGRISAVELSKLEASISDYGAAVKTGNEVLDILLTQKRMLCGKEKIEITCIAGGVDLGFVDELDQYALFSNVITNAIEAVQRLPQENKRYITLSLKEEGGMVFLHAENPCVEKIQYENGLPMTNRNKAYHGFGMKSMERIADKYNGSLSAVQKDGMFFLDIVLVR